MMFIVGIDVAKRSHEVSIITSEGQTVQRTFSISNNCTGYNCLMEKIRKLTNVRSEIVFAMESTAHYCPHTRFAGQKNNLYNGKG